MGQGETAREFYEKTLALAERLVAQEPGRADYGASFHPKLRYRHAVQPAGATGGKSRHVMAASPAENSEEIASGYPVMGYIRLERRYVSKAIEAFTGYLKG